MKVEKITSEVVVSWKKKKAEADKEEEKILDRIQYILEAIFSSEKSSLEYWWFDGVGKDDDNAGDVEKHMNDKEIWGIVTDGHSGLFGYNYILNDGREWRYEGSIPARWLYEDFENELLEGKNKFEARELEKKNSNILNKKSKKIKEQKKKELAISAMAKLSKEEIDAIRKYS